jgi:hypothetical protein
LSPPASHFVTSSRSLPVLRQEEIHLFFWRIAGEEGERGGGGGYCASSAICAIFSTAGLSQRHLLLLATSPPLPPSTFLFFPALAQFPSWLTRRPPWRARDQTFIIGTSQGYSAGKRAALQDAELGLVSSPAAAAAAASPASKAAPEELQLGGVGQDALRPAQALGQGARLPSI